LVWGTWDEWVPSVQEALSLYSWFNQGMCKNLVKKGNLSSPLIIWNRSPARAEALSAKIGNSTVAPSIEEAVSKADIVFACVVDDAAIKSVFETALKGDVRGKLFVDCSTVHPDTTSELEKMIEARGASFVACPIFGAPAMADSGQLICILAGKKEALEMVKPYCKGVMGRANIEFTDEPPRKALLLKITGNTFILGMVEALAEGHVLAEKSGLGVEALQQWIDLMFPGPYAAYSRRMTTGDYFKRPEPLFAVDAARKDVRHALNLASATGAKMKLAEVGAAHLDAVKKEKGEKGDLAGIYGAVRMESGLKFENE
jgi:3-hydroxyisobutyrate dehydrogenase-like beta-hydroxyacid dehydrogenase